MRVGIDASNLRAGGGVTHLREFLAAADPPAHGVSRVVVWAGRRTLEQLPSGAPWLDLRHEPALDGRLPTRLAWQRSSLGRQALESCDVLFAPGGLCLTHFTPFVTMSRNMLPFEAAERRRYGISPMRAKLALLRAGQAATFRRAAGVVFLTEYARRAILAYTGALPGATTVVPHGINPVFRRSPRTGVAIRREAGPACRLLYVSIVDAYKHQWHVAEAVARLRQRGWPVEIDFVGGSYGPALRRLTATIARFDPAGGFLRYRGVVPHDALPEAYGAADVFVYASSCENMPNILLEAMASGLPIACSSRGPMPEVLAEAGVYFDPEDPAAIAAAVERLLEDPGLRTQLALAARRRSEYYSWARAAHDTFELIVSSAGRRVAAPMEKASR